MYAKKLIISISEIPGPTNKNTSPAHKREEYRFSTPIEGPDNQFGSADHSDDEDDIADISEKPLNTYKSYENGTRNKTTLYSTTKSLYEHKLSNKVRKIINKFETDDTNFDINSSKQYSSFVIFYIVTFICVYIQF